MERIACLSPPALPLYCHSTVGLSLFGTGFHYLRSGLLVLRVRKERLHPLLRAPVGRIARLTGLHLSTSSTKSSLLLAPPIEFGFRVFSGTRRGLLILYFSSLTRRGSSTFLGGVLFCMIVGDHLLTVVISSKPLSGLLLSIFRICYIVYGEGSMPLPLLPCRCKAIPR